MKTSIKIYDSNNISTKMEALALFNVKNSKFNYILYKEIDEDKTYIAKYSGSSVVELITNLRKSEIEVGEIILHKILNSTLETNKEHIKANLKQLKKIDEDSIINLSGQDIKVKILQNKLVEPEEVKESKKKTDEDNEIDLIDWYAVAINKSLKMNDEHKITIDELKKIYNLDIKVSTGGSLDFLTKCTNLKKLTLNIYSNESDLNSIKSLDKLEELNINYVVNQGYISNVYYSFILNSPKLRKLAISNVKKIDNELLTNIEELIIDQKSSLDINYLNIKNLSIIDFSNSSAYDVAINFTSEMYKELIDRNIKITFNKTDNLYILEDINKKLNEIIASLSINEQDDIKKIVNKILKYIFENINFKSQNTNEFYNNSNTNGYLYNIIKEKECNNANIAMFIKTILNRLNIKAHNPNDWDEVIVNSDYYYLSSNWLKDGLIDLIEKTDEEEIEMPNEKDDLSQEMIQIGLEKNPNWYKKNLEKNSAEKNESNYIKQTVDLTGKSYFIKLDQDYEITIVNLLGILYGLGLCKLIDE